MIVCGVSCSWLASYCYIILLVIKIYYTLVQAREGCCSWSVCVFVCLFVCLSVCVCMNRFSHEPRLLWLSNADMDKYHGSSAQQDSGDVLSKQKHLPGCCCVSADL